MRKGMISESSVVVSRLILLVAELLTLMLPVYPSIGLSSLGVAVHSNRRSLLLLVGSILVTVGGFGAPVCVCVCVRACVCVCACE